MNAPPAPQPLNKEQRDYLFPPVAPGGVSNPKSLFSGSDLQSPASPPSAKSGKDGRQLSGISNHLKDARMGILGAQQQSTAMNGGAGAGHDSSHMDFSRYMVQQDTTRPLFERRREEEEMARRHANPEMEDEITMLREQLKEANARFAEVDHINVDLEHRLERQARMHVDAVAKLDAHAAELRLQLRESQDEVERWKEKHELETRRATRSMENLRRVERELYRMHQRKYDVLRGQERSEFPPGFPVPRDVHSLHPSGMHPQHGASSKDSLDSASSHSLGRRYVRMTTSDEPCTVHGRVGCPCTNLAEESRRAQAMDSLCCFFGVSNHESDIPNSPLSSFTVASREIGGPRLRLHGFVGGN